MYVSIALQVNTKCCLVPNYVINVHQVNPNRRVVPLPVLHVFKVNTKSRVVPSHVLHVNQVNTSTQVIILPLQVEIKTDKRFSCIQTTTTNVEVIVTQMIVALELS